MVAGCLRRGQRHGHGKSPTVDSFAIAPQHCFCGGGRRREFVGVLFLLFSYVSDNVVHFCFFFMRTAEIRREGKQRSCIIIKNALRIQSVSFFASLRSSQWYHTLTSAHLKYVLVFRSLCVCLFVEVNVAPRGPCDACVFVL